MAQPELNPGEANSKASGLFRVLMCFVIKYIWPGK